MRRISGLLPVLAVIGLLVLTGCGGKNAPAPPGGTMPPAGGTAAPAGGPVRVSLYVMSECPFGVPAEKVVNKVVGLLPGALDPRLVFIVSQDADGSLHSMHGQSELQKDMVHACVARVAPAKQLAFVVSHNEKGGDWQIVAKNMGLDVAAIDACLKDGAGDKMLREQLAETNQLSVSASPTLVINGQTYAGGMNSREVFEAVCAALGGKQPAACTNLPESLSRTDGSASGSCGKPKSTVPPELVDNAPLTHTVIYTDAAFDKTRMELVLNQTKALFPAVKIDKIEAGSAEGKKLIAKDHITRLPAYIFPAELATRKSFPPMSSHLVKIDDGYLLDPKVGSNFFLDRPREAKTIEIFFSPYSPRAMRMLLDIHDVLVAPEYKNAGVKINLRPYAPVENGQIAAPGGPPEVEEMLRVLAILDTRPDKVWDYLKARGENPQSTWWEDYATKIGLDPAALKKAALGDKAASRLAANSNLAAEFGLADDFALVVENRETVRLDSKDEFKTLLQKLGK